MSLMVRPQLQLPDETNALEDADVVQSMAALGASRLIEQSRAFIKSDRVACDAAARGDIPDAKTFWHSRNPTLWSIVESQEMQAENKSVATSKELVPKIYRISHVAVMQQYR